MSTVPSSSASCMAALKLQRERSATYQQWTSLFHRALLGDITPRELQRNTQGILLPEFQRISLALRTLQHTRAEQGDTVVPPWIEQLQDLEKEHYGVTLNVANQLVEHCAPNVVTSKMKEGEKAKATQQQQQPVFAASLSAEKAAVDLKSVFKVADDEEDEAMTSGEVEWREARRTADEKFPPLPAVVAEAPQATLCVHDATRCALQRLIPPRYHTLFFFVDCRDGVDDLAGTSDAPSPTSHHHQRGDGDDDGDDDALLSIYAKSNREGSSDATVAHYDAAAIAHRCAAWSRTVEPIVQRQGALRSAIEELCEELQGVISDM